LEITSFEQRLCAWFAYQFLQGHAMSSHFLWLYEHTM
jgi:hypothetical protein